MAGEYIEFVNNSQPALNEDNLNLMQQLIRQDIQSTASGDTLPIGAIMPFGSDTIPENWLLCNGQAVSRTDYQQLFNTIGITYGQGDGFTTFNLPNLKGKVVVGKDGNDEDFDTLGETGGEKEHTLTIDEMPSHNHAGTPKYYRASSVEYAKEENAQTGTQGTTSNTGGGQPHNILQPYQVQNYIIKAKQSAGVVATVVDNLNSTSTTDALSANQGKVLNEKFDYSTSEIQIGYWIDNKPIYRKVILATTDSTENQWKSITSGLNISKVVRYSGNIEADKDRPLPFNSQYQQLWLQINNGNVEVAIAGASFLNKNIQLIIEYTKTTDL